MVEDFKPRGVIIPQDIRDRWQNIVNILIEIMKVPVTLIMKVDFPSFIVFQSGDSSENPFKINQKFTLPVGFYCEKTMETNDKLLIPNALKDPEWDKNPSIPFGLISYLGFPIRYPDKKIFGTLCVLDKKENTYCKDHEDIMLQFKEIIESHLALLWQRTILVNMINQQKVIEKQLKERITYLEKELKQAH